MKQRPEPVTEEGAGDEPEKVVEVTVEPGVRVAESLKMENLENLIAQLGAGYFIVDRDQRILSMSDRLRHTLFGPTSPAGSRCNDLFKCSEESSEDCAISKAISTGETASSELVYLKDAPRLRQLKFLVAPIPSDTGYISRALVLVQDITETMKVQRELRSSVEKYETLLQNAGEGICLLDPKGRITYANPWLHEMCSADRLEGRNIMDFINQDALGHVLGQRWHGEQKRSIRIEAELRDEAGDALPIMASFMPLQGEGEQITEWVAVLADLPELTKVRQEVRVLKDLNERVLENLPSGIVVVDQEFNVLYHNASIVRMGLLNQMTAPRSDNLFEGGSPFKNLNIAHLFRTILDSKDPITLKGWQSRDPLGHERHFNFTLIPVTTEGSVSSIIATIQEITDIKVVEDQLRESEGKFRSLVENTGDGIGLLMDGKFTFTNEAFSKMFGFGDLSELINRSIDTVVAPGDREMLRGHHDSLFRREVKVVQFEFKGLRKNGSTMDVEASLKAVEMGGEPGIQATFRDITRKKQLEKDLLLSKEAAEFYTDLMAHDINNFNQGALGYLELALQNRDLEPRTGQYLSTALDQLRATTRLISRVRKLSRISAQKEIELERQDLAREVTSVLESVPAELTGRALNIVCDSGSGVYFSAVDSLFEDLLHNIITNAIKYDGNEDAVNVEIVIDKGMVSGRPHNTIRVTDHGPGVPDSRKRSIFSRFERGAKGVGSGLGLSIVQAIVHRYDGKVWVEDRVAGDHTKGSVFVVALPEI